jgi:hypothetical protein
LKLLLLELLLLEPLLQVKLIEAALVRGAEVVTPRTNALLKIQVERVLVLLHVQLTALACSSRGVRPGGQLEARKERCQGEKSKECVPLSHRLWDSDA